MRSAYEFRACLFGNLVLLAAGAAWAQKVDVDWDRDADFSKFKTYAWTDSKHPAPGLWAQPVMDSVHAKLTAAGLTEVAPSAHADLEVVYNAGGQGTHRGRRL